MKIKNNVYEGLTPKQRMIATINAQVRKDNNEFKKLIDTCPKETCLIPDPAYLHTMQLLLSLSVAVECDIRGDMIGILLAIISKQEDSMGSFVQSISNIQAAWEEVLNSYGIDPKEISKISAPKHPVFNEIQNLLPEPDILAVYLYKETLHNSLSKFN